MTGQPDAEFRLVTRESALMEPGLAAEWGLPPLPHGLLLCLLQPGGAHVTVATTDIPYWEMVVDALSPERHPEQSPPLVLPSA